MLATLSRQHTKLGGVGKTLTRRYAPLTSKYTHSKCQVITAYNGNSSNDHQNRSKGYKWNSHEKIAFCVALTGSSLVAYKLLIGDKFNAKCKESNIENEDNQVLSKGEKNIYSRKEVSEKKTMDSGVWVIYGHNVYDITDFIYSHPGGSEKIILAAGGNLEPYWDMYAFHKKPDVSDMLQEYYIGELREEDWIVEEKKAGPFANDPKRHPALLINSDEPFNAETPPALAVETLITSNDLFYVRNHLPVPDLDEKDSKLVIEGLGLEEEIVLSVEDLKTKFEQHKIICAIQCAGNRRNEMNKIKQVKGLTWSSNAISNAEWTGVYLRDVLIHAGVNPDDKNIKHVHFEGADTGPSGAPYGASIPSNRVFKRDLPVLIAFEMNGEPIPRDHGYPLRLVAPGIVGARNVKWLNRLIVSNEEYGGHWQQKDYKPFSPNIDWHNVDFSKSPAIQELPVTSAICSPQEGATFHVDEEEIVVRGYAFSGGGNGIIRVDVSVDGGDTWHTAELTQADQELDAMYSWTLWTCNVPIMENCGEKVEIVCRAVDSACNTQPEGIGPVWNLRGVLNNSWYRVNVNIETDAD